MKPGDYVTVLPHMVHTLTPLGETQCVFSNMTGRLFSMDAEWQGPEGPNYLRYGYVVFGPDAAKSEAWMKMSNLRPATDEERNEIGPVSNPALHDWEEDEKVCSPLNAPIAEPKYPIHETDCRCWYCSG